MTSQNAHGNLKPICSLDPHSSGVKLDTGKPAMTLIMHDMARALREVATVADYGARKYTPSGWLEVPDGVRRYTDAMFRHGIAEGYEAHDEETGLRHAAHLAWNALARLELMLRDEGNR